MTESEQLLHIWLIADEGDGALFITDIERMLRAVVKRQGISVKSGVPPIGSPADP